MPHRIKYAALLFGVIYLLAGVTQLYSQTSDDSQDTEDSNRDSILQKSFAQFPILTPVTDAQDRPDFETLTLTNPVVIDRERIFGFRFKVPPRKDGEDLVWAFVEPGDFKEWYILPQTNDMDGFTNYYYDTKGIYMGAKPLLPFGGNRLIFQYLPGQSLVDGQTYLIWLGFGNRNPPAMSLTFTFAHFDPADAHPLMAFRKIFSLGQLASDPIVNPYNHHTYILLRPTNWERSEEFAEKMGGHLATVRNQQEEDWIFKTFGDYGGERRLLWIGLNDLDKRFHFSWASGESTSFTDWAPYQPDNAGPRGEDYVAICNPRSPQANKWKVWNARGRVPNGLPIDGVVEIVPTNNLANPNPIVANAAAMQILPNVTITSHNGSITLQWPLSASGYILEATTNLLQPFTEFGYSEETNAETGVIYVTITNPSPQMFFKLEKPVPSQ